MQQDTPKDTPAWTARFSTVEFDCELPPEAKSELVAPRRVRPPCPPQKPPQVDSARSRGHLSPWLQSILTLVGMIFVPIFLVTVVWAILAVLSPRPAVPTKPAAPVAQPTPAVLPHGWNADGTAQGRAGTIPEVRRAELVPVPRAQLIHVRQIGSIENDLMPDGRILTTRYMGELSSAASLPTYGASLGDMWYTRADGHCWVLAPIGAGSATTGWLDP